MNPQIFKIQLPISTNVESQALIYNEDRSEEMMLPASKVAEAVGHQLKSFWYGIIDNKTLLIIKEASWQDW